MEYQDSGTVLPGGGKRTAAVQRKNSKEKASSVTGRFKKTQEKYLRWAGDITGYRRQFR